MRVKNLITDSKEFLNEKGEEGKGKVKKGERRKKGEEKGRGVGRRDKKT